jgi:hypothetical protein
MLYLASHQVLLCFGHARRSPRSTSTTFTYTFISTPTHCSSHRDRHHYHSQPLTITITAAITTTHGHDCCCTNINRRITDRRSSATARHFTLTPKTRRFFVTCRFCRFKFAILMASVRHGTRSSRSSQTFACRGSLTQSHITYRCVSTYARTHAHTHTRARARTQARTYPRMHARTHARTYTHMHTHTHTPHHTHTHTHTHTAGQVRPCLVCAHVVAQQPRQR